MKTAAAKLPPKVARKEPAVAVATSLATPLAFDGALLQRKTCTCGGGCPRCNTKLPIQAKLHVSNSGDASEREADRVAEQIVGSSLPASSGDDNLGPRISRSAVTSSPVDSPDASSAVEQALRGPSQALDSFTRAYFEPRFARSFRDVRVHVGADATDSADVLGAKAYTLGNDIVFGENQYAPSSDAGRRLLAHELTHTVQQGANKTIQRQELDDEMTERGRRFAGRQPPGAQRRDVGLAAAARSAARSIAKHGDASLGAWPNEADGTARGFQLTQNFRAQFSSTANPANYAIVQWIKGEMYTQEGGRRAYFPANTGLFGRSPTEPWLFTDWIIDTPDADPRFGSNRGLRITVPVTDFEDSPGYIQDTGTMPAGFHWNVRARVGVYIWDARTPRTIAGWESERPQPLREVAWGWDIALRPDRRAFTVNVR